ncbi:MAG: LPS-assembly protein LptD [Paracoccus sp. (in: a-proteobacteria)]
MRCLTPATICLTVLGLAAGATGAVGQSADIADPWWLSDPAYADIEGPALAPTDSDDPSHPFADGTELSSLTRAISDAPRDLTIAAAPDPMGAPGSGDAATLLADYISVSNDRTLTASGGVVVWYQGSRLIADKVRYDGASGAMTITGPIHLTRPGLAGTEDDAILIAEEAELDQNMRDGLLRGARLVLAREMQLAADRAELSGEGRFTTLDHVVASSCRICAVDPIPLWEIRARQITHDAQENQLIFDHPQLRAYGFPIAAWPGRVSAPDPTVDRMSGFLRPRIRTTSKLGFGIMQPYFKTLGPTADLTLTPYLSASQTSTLMLRYRQAYWNGATEWNGAISRDDIRDGKTRGYLFGAARWELPRGYELGLQVQMVSDDGYLLDYGISDADRLWSGVTLDQVSENKLVWARIGNYHSLRDDEDNITSPAQIADMAWTRRWQAAGGTAQLEWSAHAHRRPSSEDVIGRDMARTSLDFDWRRSQVLAGGFLATGAAGISSSLYSIHDDSQSESTVVQTTPWISAGLRFPMTGNDGTATYVLEPVAQLVWSPDDDGSDIPNEDSRQVEFDEGNLFALSRYPGWDAHETGLRANLGLTWTRFDPTGWQLSLASGRILRKTARDNPDIPALLRGTRSDWLIAGHYADNSGLTVANRALFSDDFQINRNELRIGWARPELQLGLGHLWMQANQFEGRGKDLSELTGEVGWQLANGWWATAYGRHDLEENRAQKAGFGVTYRNECISVELAASRRFTDTDTIDPDTDIDLSVRLGGFGRAPSGKGTVARRNCLR